MNSHFSIKNINIKKIGLIIILLLLPVVSIALQYKQQYASQAKQSISSFPLNTYSVGLSNWQVKPFPSGINPGQPRSFVSGYYYYVLLPNGQIIRAKQNPDGSLSDWLPTENPNRGFFRTDSFFPIIVDRGIPYLIQDCQVMQANIDPNNGNIVSFTDDTAENGKIGDFCYLKNDAVLVKFSENAKFVFHIGGLRKGYDPSEYTSWDLFNYRAIPVPNQKWNWVRDTSTIHELFEGNPRSNVFYKKNDQIGYVFTTVPEPPPSEDSKNNYPLELLFTSTVKPDGSYTDNYASCMDAARSYKYECFLPGPPHDQKWGKFDGQLAVIGNDLYYFGGGDDPTGIYRAEIPDNGKSFAIDGDILWTRQMIWHKAGTLPGLVTVQRGMGFIGNFLYLTADAGVYYTKVENIQLPPPEIPPPITQPTTVQPTTTIQPSITSSQIPSQTPTTNPYPTSGFVPSPTAPISYTPPTVVINPPIISFPTSIPPTPTPTPKKLLDMEKTVQKTKILWSKVISTLIHFSQTVLP